MQDDASKGLAEGWEATTDDLGRTYWWHSAVCSCDSISAIGGPL
jgi:hypothetical protein